MNLKTKLALTRAAKAIAAGAISVAIAQVPDVSSAVGGSDVLVPLLTALLLAAEKYVRFTPAAPAK